MATGAAAGAIDSGARLAQRNCDSSAASTGGSGDESDLATQNFILHGCIMLPDLPRNGLKCKFMSQLLAGKTALILGIANKWSIAYAIAKAFRREGAKLILTYQGERLKQSVEELGGELGAASAFDCDVTKPADLERLTETLKAEGRLDAVVHSIAFANREDISRPFVETSRDGFSLALDVSAYSFVAVAKATAPLMTEGGALMTLTYLGSTRVLENYNVMGVAKAALEASVRYLASDLGSSRIRVNAISAGPIKTAAARGIKDFSKILEAVSSRAPLRRNTDPAEVADLAVFLASDMGRGVTGDVLFVDSGFHIMGL
jgi:enoyl-[acyl-carrier protein] reductase I